MGSARVPGSAASGRSCGRPVLATAMMRVCSRRVFVTQANDELPRARGRRGGQPSLPGCQGATPAGRGTTPPTGCGAPPAPRARSAAGRAAVALVEMAFLDAGAGHAACGPSQRAPSRWRPRSAAVCSSAASCRLPGWGDVRAAGVRVERHGLDEPNEFGRGRAATMAPDRARNAAAGGRGGHAALSRAVSRAVRAGARDRGG